MSETPQRFVYVTYIRTTAGKLWSALTDGDFAQQYWLGVRPEADWREGGEWRLILTDDRIADIGQIVEFDVEKRLSIRWRNEFKSELKAEGWTLCTMEIETVGNDAVKLTVSHEMDGPGVAFIASVANGWPQILSNLKSLLETGEVVIPQRPRTT